MNIQNSINEYLMSDVSLIHIKTFEHIRGIFLGSRISKNLGYTCGILWKNNLEATTIFGECAIEASVSETGVSMKSLLKFIKKTTTKTVIIIQDIHRIYNDPCELAYLQESIEQISSGSTPINIIGVAPTNRLPSELERYAYIVDFPLPTRKEIRGIVAGQLKEHGITIGTSMINRLAEAFNGLIGDEIRLVLNRIVVTTIGVGRFIDESSIHMVLQQKKQIIQKSGLLEFVDPDVNIDDVGGLHNLKHWLMERKEVFNDIEKAASYGIKPPKGILLFGMPGSGKSLTAKVTASYYKLPLLRMDMGLIYGQKSPEEAISRIISISDSIAPCVLWIDELEKALAGSESGASNDVAIKILGILLTWMQERTAPVFIIATANDISMIRPETYRDGRIDEKFFLGFLEDDLVQIEQIIMIHLKKRLKENYHNVVQHLDIQAIAKKMSQMVVQLGGKNGAGYTGANLEALVEKVLMERFVHDKPQVETRDFIRMLNVVKPQHGLPIKIMLKHAEEMEAIHA